MYHSLLKDCRNVQQREPCIRTRFVIAVTSFVGLGIILGQRASFSVALVAMVNFTNIDDQNTTTADQCPEIEGHVNSSTIKLKVSNINREVKDSRRQRERERQSDLVVVFVTFLYTKKLRFQNDNENVKATRWNAINEIFTRNNASQICNNILFRPLCSFNLFLKC